MKKFILFFFISFSGFAQKTISYADLKKMVDVSESEAVRIMKSKGFGYSYSDEDLVVYNKDNSSFSIDKWSNGAVRFTFYSKKYEYISTNILKYIRSIGYKEVQSGNNGNLGFCTLYHSTNYYIRFCDNIAEYEDGTSEPSFTVSMNLKEKNGID